MKKLFYIILIAVFVAMLCVSGTFVFEFFVPHGALAGPSITFVIEPSSGVHEISRNLREKGLVTSSFIFETYVWLARADRKFQAGNYTIAPGMSMRGLTKLFIAANVPKEQNLTIIEGWTLRDIKSCLVKSGVGDMQNFDGLVGISAAVTPGVRDWSTEFPVLRDKPKDFGYEGYLFPDTYRVFKDATAEDAVRKMLQNFERKFDSRLRAAAAQKNMTVFEVVTLASIVEREVQSQDDMRKIAGIFLRRLKLGMPLQADSTVNYVTGKSTPAISYDDREINSPWNTYKYPGLPKGPVGNPGMTAIWAVLEPEETPHLYFLTTKDSRVIYSRTLDEHNRAKAKYLK